MPTIFQDEFVGSGSIAGRVPDIGFLGVTWANGPYPFNPVLGGGEMTLGVSGNSNAASAAYKPASATTQVTEADAYVVDFIWKAGNIGHSTLGDVPLYVDFASYVPGSDTEFHQLFFRLQLQGGGWAIDYSANDDFDFSEASVPVSTPVAGTDYPGTMTQDGDGYHLSFMGLDIDMPLPIAPNRFLNRMSWTGSEGCAIKRIQIEGGAPTPPEPGVFWTQFRNTREVV